MDRTIRIYVYDFFAVIACFIDIVSILDIIKCLKLNWLELKYQSYEIVTPPNISPSSHL